MVAARAQEPVELLAQPERAAVHRGGLAGPGGGEQVVTLVEHAHPHGPREERRVIAEVLDPLIAVARVDRVDEVEREMAAAAGERGEVHSPMLPACVTG